MTITKPGNKTYHAKFLLVCAALVVVGGVGVVLEYNGLVGLRDAIREARAGIVEEKLKQADLKHVVFEKTAPLALQEIARKYALIVEEDPVYLRLTHEGGALSLVQ